MYRTSLHLFILIFAFLKLFVKVTAFTVLLLLLQSLVNHTTGEHIAILSTLPPFLRGLLLATILWTLLLPLYFDISAYFANTIIVHQRQFLYRQGLFIKNHNLISCEEIENVMVVQSDIGKKFDFGDVHIVIGNGKKPFVVKFVRNPRALQKVLQEALIIKKA